MADSKIIQERNITFVQTGDLETCFSGIEAAAEQIACLHSKILELRAIVAKLDRSLDGVPLVDGDEVWVVTDGDLVHGTYSVLGYYTPAEGFDGFRSLKGNHDRWICYLKYDPDTKTVGCWSSREAAEKAEKGT